MIRIWQISRLLLCAHINLNILLNNTNLQFPRSVCSSSRSLCLLWKHVCRMEQSVLKKLPHGISFRMNDSDLANLNHVTLQPKSQCFLLYNTNLNTFDLQHISSNSRINLFFYLSGAIDLLRILLPQRPSVTLILHKGGHTSGLDSAGTIHDVRE